MFHVLFDTLNDFPDQTFLSSCQPQDILTVWVHPSMEHGIQKYQCSICELCYRHTSTLVSLCCFSDIIHVDVLSAEFSFFTKNTCKRHVCHFSTCTNIHRDSKVAYEWQAMYCSYIVLVGGRNGWGREDVTKTCLCFAPKMTGGLLRCYRCCFSSSVKDKEIISLAPLPCLVGHW